MQWYAKESINIHDQGLVIDEDTGRNVAVAYDGKDAKRIAREHNAIDLIAQIAPRNDDATFRKAVQEILTEYRLNWQAGQGDD
jgi:hypothetical protein